MAGDAVVGKCRDTGHAVSTRGPDTRDKGTSLGYSASEDVPGHKANTWLEPGLWQ